MLRIQNISIIIYFLVSFLILPLTALAGNVWYVDSESTCAVSCGTGWSNAFKTIQDAISAANSGDEIWIKKGNYLLTSQINVNKAVFIYGGFGGAETQKEQRDWQNNIVTVDGGYLYRCFLITTNTTIDGLTITGGNAPGKKEGSGGGILITNSSSPNIANSNLTKNMAKNGAGLLIETGSGNPTIKNCIFSENIADVDGGGLNRSDTKITIDSCIFINNSANNGGGGGMLTHLGHDTSTINNCIFIGNKAFGSGGGIRHI